MPHNSFQEKRVQIPHVDRNQDRFRALKSFLRKRTQQVPCLHILNLFQRTQFGPTGTQSAPIETHFGPNETHPEPNQPRAGPKTHPPLQISK
jgi:hypothetical protein